MSKTILCDLCSPDCVGGRVAVGWFQGVDGNKYYLCKQHTRTAIQAQRVVHYFLQEEERAKNET